MYGGMSALSQVPVQPVRGILTEQPLSPEDALVQRALRMQEEMANSVPQGTGPLKAPPPPGAESWTDTTPVEEEAAAAVGAPAESPMQQSYGSYSSASTTGLYEKPVRLGSQAPMTPEDIRRAMVESQRAYENAQGTMTSEAGMKGLIEAQNQEYQKQMAKEEGVARAKVDWQLEAQKIQEETEARTERATIEARYAKLPGGFREYEDLQYSIKHGTPEEKQRAQRRLEWASSINGNDLMKNEKNVIMAAIGMALGAFGASLLKQQNVVPAIIDKAIAREGARQRSLFETAQTTVDAEKTRYGILMKHLGNEGAVINMMEAQIGREAANLARKHGAEQMALQIEAQAFEKEGKAKMDLAEFGMKSQLDVDRTNLARFGAGMQSRAMGMRAEEQQLVQGMAPPGMLRFPGYEKAKLSSTTIRDVQKKQTGHLLSLSAYDQLIDWANERGGARVVSKFKYGSQEYNEAQQQFGRLISALKEKRGYGAALTDGEKKLLAAEAGGSPLQIGAYFENLVTARANSIEEYGNEMATYYHWTDELVRRGYTPDMWRARGKEKNRSSVLKIEDEGVTEAPPAQRAK